MKTRISFFAFVLLFILTLSLFTPGVASAQEGTPPTSEPVSSGDVAETDDLPVTPEPAGTEVPVQETIEPVPSIETETVAEVAQALGEADAVLLGEDGDPIVLATQEAAEVIAGSDPYFFNGTTWVGYSTSGICPAVVTVCNTSSTPFQAAIDAALAGTTIYVETGTYAEQLVIDHSLTLVGNGSLNTFINAPAVLAAGTNGERSIITITGAATSVDFSGFTVSGPGSSGCNSINYGIFVRDGANANIHDNVVTDIRDNPLGGCQNGIAIGVGRTAYGTTGTATIEDNTITDFQKGAIVVDNTGSDATIDGNTISGAGPISTIAQNGIQISRGATAEVTDNTISGFDYLIPDAGYPWTSAGILLYQPGETLVDGNTVTDSNIGIYDYQSSNVVISNNTVSESCSDEVGGGPCEHDGWGIYSAQSTNLEITDNTITDNVIGVGVNNSNGVITGNLFDGNDTGMVNYGSSTVDATYNCWGSDSGPTNAANLGGSGDVAGDNIIFDPWECAPVSTPAPTTGEEKEKASAPSDGMIPVTGRQMMQIECNNTSAVYEIDDVRVIFNGLCGYSVVIDNVTEDALPGGIDDANQLIRGLSITLLKGTRAVNVMPLSASIQISYIEPEMEASVLEWKETEWSELVTSAADDRLLAELTLPNTFVVMVTQ
jgi:parallel beta-helix repeat protein